MSNSLTFYSKFQHLDLRTAILQPPCCSNPPRFFTLKPASDFASPFSSSLFTSTSLPPSCFTFSTKVANCSYAPAADCSCEDGPNGSDEETDDDDGGVGFLDDCQIIRECDKVINAFMVEEEEEPEHALADWRRLLVLNKEWSNIRPHFFRRCQDRAGDEDDPQMKRKLLWLGKRLKEIDEDLQRRDELIEMINGKPSEISEKSRCFSPGLVGRWLRSCHNVEEVGRVHSIVLKCFRDSVTYVDNNLICIYLRLGKLDHARRVFDGMPSRSTVTWTAIIDGYLKFNLYDEALKLFHDSIKQGVQANNKMFVCVVNLCGKRLDLGLGKQIHAHILKSNWRNLIVDSAVVNFYAKCGEISSAFRAFDRMAERDVVCWTTMITACSQQGLGHDSLLMLSQMLGDGFFPNEYTVCGALKACGEIKALKFGTQLHGTIVKKICKSDVFVGTSLIDMYAKCGETVNSQKVFDRMRVRNTATWTSIISGYARNGIGEEAINLFRLMKTHKVHVNKMTIASVMMACGSTKALLIGREVHAQIIKSIIHTNIYIGTALVWFYLKCKEYSHALKLLQLMPFRDVVSWTAIISGCAKLGLESEALEFLQEMMEEGVVPNAYTYTSALKACANLEAPMQGKLIHSYASKTPALSNVFVNSALISMYAKCGYVDDAFQVFDNMPKRNLVSWKAMILGYVRNGHCKEALKLMYRMQAEGFVVDDYILSTVLTACGGIDCVDIDWDFKPPSHYLHSS